MIRVETCDYCRGRKVAERLDEMVGGEWRALPSSVFADLPPWHRRDAQDILAREYPAIIRWSECACPRCDGRGEYDVEHVACKIF